MSKTALIILAAVVVLIVIVVLTGMRYLRADDEDDFDGRSAERGRSAGHDLPAGRGRTRRDEDGDWQPASGRAREARVPGGRAAQPRTVHGRAAVQRPGKPVRRGQDMGDDLAPVGARSGRLPADPGGRRGPQDYDGPPSRPPVGAREYESREYDDREYDDRDARGGRQARKGRERGGQPGRDDLAKHDDSRPDVARRGSRASGRSDDRQDDGPPRRADALPAVRPRQGRAKRDGDGDWPSNEWDELSDVDYWAELASDRPLTPNTARPAKPAGRPSRSAPRRDLDARDAEPGPTRSSRHGGTGEHELPPRLPVRQQVRDDPAATSVPAGSGGEFGVTSPRRASEPRSEPTLAMLANMGPDNDGFRPAGSADDDPLTSPSFPRIAADDSRSYRRGRPEQRGQDARGATPPGGYPRSAGIEQEYPAATLAATDSQRRAPSANSGQHSYPGQAPAADAGGYLPPVPPSYPALTAGAGQHSGRHTMPADADGYAAAAHGGYPAQVPGDRPAYPADANTVRYSSQAPAASSYPAAATGSYPAPAGNGYPAQAVGQGGHQLPQARDYLSEPDPPLRAAYPGGYPASASTSAHQIPAASYQAGSAASDYATGHPSGPLPGGPAAYPGYAAGGLSGGPTVPYLPNLDAAGSAGYGSAPHSIEPEAGYPGLPEAGYPGYPAGSAGQFAAAPAGGYPASPPLPSPSAGFGAGYPVGSGPSAGSEGYPAGQFHSAPYEPAGYPAPVPETGGYAGSDPYAMDPYGHPGYRSGF